MAEKLRPGRAGNFAGSPTDLTTMGCSSCRELLSADLDGEADPVALQAARAHLSACAECAAWFERATQVNRLMRTAPADPGPGLSAERLSAVLEHLPRGKARRIWHLSARGALAAVGAVQIMLGAISLAVSAGAAQAVHTGHEAHPAPSAPSLLGAGMAHMSHESSAWNLALGIAFLAGAVWIRHLAGLLPVLGSFVLVLFLVSVVDLIGGHVDAGRVAAHVLVAGGLGLIVLIVKTGPTDLRPHPVSQEPEDCLAAEAGEPWVDEGTWQRATRARRRPDPAARRRVA